MTASLYFASPGQILVAAILVGVSNVGFGLSENFISAFLPHIATRDNIGKISGLAWGLGYFGGLSSIILCQYATDLVFSLENFHRLRWIGPITATFFVLGSIPTFLFVREPPHVVSSEPLASALRSAYQRLFNTLASVGKFRDLRTFLTANFFFQGGVAIVISFTALYANQVVGIEGMWQAVFFISLQVSAALGAFAFGTLQVRLGSVRSINVTLLIWLTTTFLIYFLKPLGVIFGVEDLKLAFILVANMAGLCLGATQCCARALVGIFSPPEKSGEFFGFWGFSGKLASVFAVITFGTLQKVFSLEQGILFCALLFGLGFVLNQKVNEARGRNVATGKPFQRKILL